MKTFQITNIMTAEISMKNKTEEKHEGKTSQNLTYRRGPSRWRRSKHGDHIPPHKYIKNTSTCGTTPTEHLLNAGLSPPKSKKLPTYLGSAKEKEKTETKE